DDAIDGLVAGASGAITVLAASKGRQFSFEAPSQAGGYFTAALLTLATAEGRQQADLDGSGLIELDELYFALKKQVFFATEGHQTPWIVRSQMVGKTPLL